MDGTTVGLLGITEGRLSALQVVTHYAVTAASGPMQLLNDDGKGLEVGDVAVP